jgi:hypothetical protein
MKFEAENKFTTERYSPICLHIEADCDVWSKEYTVDRLKQHLTKVTHTFLVEGGRAVTSRKYYDQAFHHRKIGVYKPPLPYIINISDLKSDPRLLNELLELSKDEEMLGYVLRQAVGRIFEDVNFELYHNSISRVLIVRLEK